MWKILYAGVDHTIPGNGGADCISYLSPLQRVAETVLLGLLAGAEAYYGYRSVRLPTKIVYCDSPAKQCWKQVFLTLLCLIFGMELGYKCATQSIVYLLNPCHVTTMLQIILLVMDPRSRVACALFRFHMYSMTGATLALWFPVLNTRQLPYEIVIYYMQHALILVLPLIMMSFGGGYAVESVTDFSWAWLSYGILLVYHFLPLQAFALASEVNLNNMLCPAVSDPFRGPYYRLWAAGHQQLFIIIHAKLYICAAKILLKIWRFFVPVQNALQNFDDHQNNNHAIMNGNYCHNNVFKLD